MAKFEIIKKDINGKTSNHYVSCDNVHDSGTLMNLYFDEVNEAIERKKGEAIVSVTKYKELITECEIIELRDTMEVSELRKITNKCMDTYGFVTLRYIFMTMGYVHAFNDKWHNVQTKL